MSDLNKNSKMECKTHGLQKPSFICQHLQYGDGLEYIELNKVYNPEFPFREMWCNSCDEILMKEGEWNDVSEGFAKILAICEGCFNEIQSRNFKKDVD